MSSELKTILLVEDEEHIQTVAKMALELNGGYEIELACNGKEMLDAYQRRIPDLILLDVMMPQLDGPSALEKLNEIYPDGHSPVIFMTAKVQGHEKERFMNMGALGVIAKPFDPMTLAEEIRSLWSQGVTDSNA